MAWCRTKKANKLLKMNPSDILVFDLETTGVLSNAEILQISIVDGYGMLLFSSYVKPKVKKWPSAEKVNHISPAMVENAPRFKEIKAEVQEYFDRAKLIAGYNSNRFDIPLIQKYGINVPSNRFDVMQEYKAYFKLERGYKLTDCADYFGEFYNPHDASSDAEVTAKCMQKLIRLDGFVKTNDDTESDDVENTEINFNYDCKKKAKSKKIGILYRLSNIRRIHPLIIGFVLFIVGVSYINTVSNGVAISLHNFTWDVDAIREFLTAGAVNKVFFAMIPVGIVLILRGIYLLLRSFVWGVRNFIHRVITFVKNIF